MYGVGNKITAILLFSIILISPVFTDKSPEPQPPELPPGEEKNILIIHSYHQGLEWTDHLTEGIMSVFRERRDISMFFEYMDTKRYYNQNYINALEQINEVKERQIPIDVVITTDNAAYGFMKEHRENYPGVPVVFCGVNNLDTSELVDFPDFYGFEEKADHKGTLEAIRRVFPERKNILIVNDNTLTGGKILQELENVLPEFDDDFNFELISEFTLDSLKTRIKALDNSYTVYLLVLNRDINGNFISYAKGISEIASVCEVPIFGSWDFYIDRGLFGGKIVEGFEHGRSAALLALNILDNGITENIDQYNTIESNYIFDFHEMEKFSIDSDQLPENSIVINVPPEDSSILKVIFTIAVSLLCAVLVLVVRLAVDRRRERLLQKLVDERTAALNDTNLKLEDIIFKNRKFFSILAHDLRNSIGALVQTSNLLNDDENNLSDEDDKKFRKEMYNCSTKTNSLLEDLLYWGNSQFMNNPNLNITDLRMDEILRSTADIFKYNHGNVSFDFDIEDDIVISNDVNIVMFIFRNIIQNAVKYSRRNGVVGINCARKDSCVIVEVSDDGIGMTPEIIESIYNRKPVLQKGTFDIKNSGIGLATILDYLDEINGEISFDSEKEQGTTITVKIQDLA